MKWRSASSRAARTGVATSVLACVKAPASSTTTYAPPSHLATVIEGLSALDPAQRPVSMGIPPTQVGQSYCDLRRRVKDDWKQGRKAVITFSILPRT